MIDSVHVIDVLTLLAAAIKDEHLTLLELLHGEAGLPASIAKEVKRSELNFKIRRA